MDAGIKERFDNLAARLDGIVTVDDRPHTSTFSYADTWTATRNQQIFGFKRKLGAPARYARIFATVAGKLFFSIEKRGVNGLEIVREELREGLLAGVEIEFEDYNLVELEYQPTSFPTTVRVFGSR